MEEKMLCFQCEQTARGIACTTTGVCGKTPEVSLEQDILTCEMIALASAADARQLTPNEQEKVSALLVDGLFTTVTNVSFNAYTEAVLTQQIKTLRRELGGEETIVPADLFHGEENAVSLR